MNFDRKDLFRFPWSRTDNPGAWIEVTDICDLNCPGCFRRNNLEGHRQLSEVKKEILMCRDQLNCSRICISGGEPLLYPDIIEIVNYISCLKMKPIILTNGEKLTWDLLMKLKKAGLYQFYFHVDSGQNRPGWIDCNEKQMNELRQYYADLAYKAGKIKCGYNLTIRRSNFNQIHDIVKWFRANPEKVNQISLITYRGITAANEYTMIVNDKKIDLALIGNNIQKTDEINITTLDIHNELQRNFEYVYPSAYLNGTPNEETYKYLIITNIVTKHKVLGEIGAKTIEAYQFLYHVFKNKYDVTVVNPGRSIFLLGLLDKRLRKAFIKYFLSILHNPLRIFDRIYTQALILQQPFEIIDGKPNLCDGCINLMPYKGKLINSCRLDEYRLLGGPLTLINKSIIE